MEKVCSICKELKPLSEFCIRRASSDGRMPRCKACDREYHKVRPIARYYQYKKDAQKRNIDFCITLEEFSSFFGKPCYYCKKDMTNRIGIDRIDSSKGYMAINIVPCCINCNSLKGFIERRMRSMLRSKRRGMATILRTIISVL
jgi:hypothetical protein